MQILETTGDSSVKFDESDEYIQEAKSYLEILGDDFGPEIDQLYINFPIAILDFKDLFLDQCPYIEPTQLR